MRVLVFVSMKSKPYVNHLVTVPVSDIRFAIPIYVTKLEFGSFIEMMY